MDFSQNSYVDLGLILLVAFVLMLPSVPQSGVDVIVPSHIPRLCRCGSQYMLTLYDNGTVTFDQTQKRFSVSDTEAITDYLYGSFVNFNPEHLGVTLRADENVSYSTLFALTEHLKNNGVEIVAWSRLQ